MRNLQKGFIVPVLLVIITVFLIGGGVYVYNNEKLNIPVAFDSEIPPTYKPDKTLILPTLPTVNTIAKNSEPATTEQIEQEKIRENLLKNQNEQPVEMISKSCTNNIKPEESSSQEFSSLVGQWTFKKAIISDFNCDDQKDVVIASYQSYPEENFFKINLQFFQKVSGSWKLISQKDFLGEPFEIYPAKTNEGANAVALTFDSSSIERIVWLRNDGYLTGI